MTQPKITTDKIPTQTSTGFLDGLRGINPSRDIHGREPGNLEKLVETVKQAVESFAGKTKYKMDWLLNGCDLSIYNYLNRSLKDMDFSEKDLSDLVIGMSDFSYDNNQQMALGMCTGALLQLITKINKKKGKGTAFYINGNGNRFDYLFFYSKKIDALIVENFKGNNICSYVGSYGGKANLIIANNITGNGTLDWAGSNKGKVGVAIANNITGDDTLRDAGSYNGRVSVVVANNITGDYTLRAAESVGVVIANNITGYGQLWHAGRGGGNISVVYYHKAPGILSNRITAGKIISGEQAIKEYQEITSQCKVDEFLALTESLEGKTGEEIAGIAGQFKNLRAQIPKKYLKRTK